jgi:hypothetical protein
MLSDIAQNRFALRCRLPILGRESNMTQEIEDGSWRSVAEKVSKEMDPAKLTVLVAKLCRAFEIEDERRPKTIPAVI